MAKRKGILNAALKALLVGVETSVWVKIPATFIAELASLPKDKQEVLAGLSQEQFNELLTQSDLATLNAAAAAVGTDQIKKMVTNSYKLTKNQLATLSDLTQKEFERISPKLDDIDETTKDTNKEVKEIKAIVNKLAKNQLINPDIKAAVQKIFVKILQEENIDQWQWPEKLQEIAKRHQELLDKWQTFESVDSHVDRLRKQAHAAILKGYYDKAESFFEQAVAIDDKAIAAQEENLAKRKVSKSQSLAAQADLAKTKLNFSKAIKLYTQALDGLPASQEMIQARYLNYLGLLYQTTAQYEKAKPLYKRAMAIDEASFGPDHPKVAIRLNNLAQLYKATNRLAAAEPLMKRAMAIDEASFGPDHPNMAIRLNNLAQLYQDTNRLADAEPLMKQALAIDEASFGPDHPDVAIDLNNLAGLHQDTNRRAEAEPMYGRAVEIFETSLGADHPSTITVRENWESCRGEL